MNSEKRIVKMSDGTEKEITIIISFKYEKNNKNYIVYNVENSESALISSFSIVDDKLVLEEISEEENTEISAVLKDIISGGNS